MKVANRSLHAIDLRPLSTSVGKHTDAELLARAIPSTDGTALDKRLIAAAHS
jgi:hypothetical protein